MCKPVGCPTPLASSVAIPCAQRANFEHEFWSPSERMILNFLAPLKQAWNSGQVGTLDAKIHFYVMKPRASLGQQTTWRLAMMRFVSCVTVFVRACVAWFASCAFCAFCTHFAQDAHQTHCILRISICILRILRKMQSRSPCNTARKEHGRGGLKHGRGGRSKSTKCTRLYRHLFWLNKSTDFIDLTRSMQAQTALFADQQTLTMASGSKPMRLLYCSWCWCVLHLEWRI